MLEEELTRVANASYDTVGGAIGVLADQAHRIKQEMEQFS